jgi:TonB family protein
MLTVTLAMALTLSAQTPQGQRIPAKDGDVIVTELGAKFRIVRHAEGQARVVYNASRQWVLVLMDYTGAGGTPDGVVDASYYFRSVTTWPLGERWDGHAALDEYSTGGEPMVGLGLTIAGAFVQLISDYGTQRGGDAFKDPAATAVVSFTSFGRGGALRLGFDAAEQIQSEVVSRPPPSGASTAPGPARGPVSDTFAPSPAPVRVGGNIPLPTKIKDVRPALPDAAAQAGIRGVVIVEIVIAPDGSVQDAKILRSIPLLDAAALDAVRQWRYTPTLLNGQPVPVIMTATVAFQ